MLHGKITTEPVEVGLARAKALRETGLLAQTAQRAALARALVRDPDLLLLDEPFAALDALTRIKAQALVAELWRRHGCAVLLVTHDVEEAILLADRVLVMREGVIDHHEEVALSRPRDVADLEFARIRRALLDRLGVHQGAAH